MTENYLPGSLSSSLSFHSLIQFDVVITVSQRDVQMNSRERASERWREGEKEWAEVKAYRLKMARESEWMTQETPAEFLHFLFLSLPLFL